MKDLLVMIEIDPNLFEKSEIISGLVRARTNRANGSKGYSPEDVYEMCEDKISKIEAENG